MKKALVAAAAVVALPVMAHAQSPVPGFYGGVEGGVSWLLNTTIAGQGVYPATGWAAGGKFGYDFVGPRVEIEGVYHENQTSGGNFPGQAIQGKIGQAAVMANILYDFNAGGVIVPFVGAGAGVGFIDSDLPLRSTQFAFQGILGVGWNATPNLRFDLDGRYFGTTNPNFAGSAWSNNSFAVMLGVTFKFGAPVEAAPPPPPPMSAPSFMVFFDWDRSNLSAQALNTIKQAADAYRTKGNARITATGHTDTSGPANYNMALSLRRANAVKDALVRDGVPATAISVVGKGETDLLVPTGDGVREPQNRRVVIVIQ
jgi:outer membrane protein OmpA-like peptidoglycan-associated protein